LIQVYTGNGKGKTTAALGLALRASGAGLKVYIAQFCKGQDCGELRALKKLKNIKLEQFGRSCFITKPTPKDIYLARSGLKKVNQVIKNDSYNIVILDEITVALKLKLISLKDVLALLKNTPKNIELVLTGRHAPSALIKAADLVSEIKEAKHYYNKGIRARKGIES